MRLILLCLMTIIMFITVFFSFSWRIEHDTPIMIYISHLISTHYCIPYRDLFDMNMPGTYFTYALFEKCLGLSDLSFRIADIICLSIISTSAFITLRHFNIYSGWFAAIAFGLVYLGRGLLILQREYLMLVPISLALAIICHQIEKITLPVLFISGFLWGYAIIIKPHVFFPFIIFTGVMIYLSILSKQSRYYVSITALTILGGFLIPVISSFIYLYKNNILIDFYNIVKNYLPLYGAMNGNHEVISGIYSVLNIIEGIQHFGGFGIILIPVTVALFIYFHNSQMNSNQQKSLILITALMVGFIIYPAFSGQFWQYHWLPMVYFTILISSLCFSMEINQCSKFTNQSACFVMIIVFLCLYHSPGQLFKHAIPKDGRPDVITTYLESHLHPGDKVQPVDWTAGGIVHGLLMANAKPATRFIYTFHFYHHISTPYIKALRGEFIKELRQSRPRFIISSEVEPPWPKGPDTTRSFPELENLIAQSYKLVYREKGVLIYELKFGHQITGDDL